jgi:hypothetical protein
MFDKVASIDLNQCLALVDSIPDPTTWEASAIEMRNTAISQTRGYVFRYQEEDTPNRITPIRDTKARELHPEIEPFYDLVTSLGYGTLLGRARINYLPPGGEILPHIDRGIYFRMYTRFLIPLMTNEGVFLNVGGVDIHPKMGDVYLFDNQQTHYGANNGLTGRLHLIIDVKHPLRGRKVSAEERSSHFNTLI